MKYSVLMSVYKKDDPEFLKTALQSIYEKQTRKPDEIVIVFDGPLTERLHVVLEEFRENKQDIVCFYPQETNQGLGAALRIGAEYCTGDYIFRMDSDDISKPNRFEKQIGYVEAHPEVDVLGANIAEFTQAPDKTERYRICPETHAAIIKMAKRRCPVNHVSVCIKRSALMRSGNYQPLPMQEDYYLWVRMLADGCVFANLSDVLIDVRIGNGFIAKRGTKVILNSLLVIQRYMVDHGMISRITAVYNMACRWVLISSPPVLKDFFYKHFLRK